MIITRREFLSISVVGGLELSKIRKFNPFQAVLHASDAYDPKFDSPFQAILNATVRIKRYTYYKDGNPIIRVGTGFVYKKDGYAYNILTNYHVIQNLEREGIVEERANIILRDDSIASTIVKKVDREKDFAVIGSAQSELSEKVLPSDYPYLQWNNPTLEVGDKLFIVGYQEGITLETSIGYVTSTKKKDIDNGYNHYDVWFLSNSKIGNSGASVLKEVKHQKFGTVYEYVGMFHATEEWPKKKIKITPIENSLAQILKMEKKVDVIYRSKAILFSEFAHMLKAA